MFVNARRLLAALVLAGCGVVVGQLPAHACSCVTTSTQAQAKAAHDVFTGTVTDVTRERGAGGAVTRTYDVQVERVYKGDVATATARVASSGDGASCGLGGLVADRRYVFFAKSGGAGLSANACSGTARASDRLVSKVERLLGEGRVPVAPAPETAVFTRVADSGPPTLTRTAAPGLALILVGLLGLVVVRRVARRS